MSEGRKTNEECDFFLEERLNRYDKWLSEEKISFSSRVIPVSESLQAKQWVIPSEQVMQILGKARSITLTDCECRAHYERCDNPIEVCLLLNDTGDKFVSMGKGRHILLDEAAEVLRKADENGLVHLTLYQPDHQVYAVCNCCTCCCHDLQIIRKYNRKDLVVRSDYVVSTDMDVCINCGDCIDRCVFNARTWNNDGEVQYNPGACYGCGLCVTVCPVEATRMKPISDQPQPPSG